MTMLNRFDDEPIEPLMTNAEVAKIFKVDPKTVTRWSKKGLLPVIRTLGGHRRYRQSDVAALIRKKRPQIGMSQDA